MKSKMIVAIAAGALLALAGTAAAYHDGGVARCEGCHTMHNSKNNAQMTQDGETGAVNPPQFSGNPFLLQGPDQSSTCLNCHGRAGGGSYRVYSPGKAAGAAPDNFTPGGDFAWLKKTFTWVSHGSTKTENGDTHGHNIIALNFGLVADSRLAAAPGGTFPAAQLGCHSCHDPHGKTRIKTDGTFDENLVAGGPASEPIRESGSYGATPSGGEAVGVYRLLAGNGYTQKGAVPTGVTFAVDPPVAVAPSTYNKYGASAGDAYKVRVAYGDGMSDWCGTCHDSIHTGGPNIHPTDQTLPSAILQNYNTYVKSGDRSGDFSGIAEDGPYSTLVPYEEGTTDRTVLSGHATDDITVAGAAVGPAGGEKVMCLSCHRAHASGWESMTRWNNTETFLVVGGVIPGTDAPTSEAQDEALGRSQEEYMAAHYNTPVDHFATYQRSMCNKCHAKD